MTALPGRSAGVSSLPADARRRQAQLGEWAALGVLAQEPAHGWAVARRLGPDGDVGRVWSLSRPLTYRALETLVAEGLVRPRGSEPGAAGPNRTILVVTPAGVRALRTWLATPVEHLRDVRSELLLKLVLAEQLVIDTRGLVAAQREIVERLVARSGPPDDVVGRWRHESTQAVLRFLDRLHPP